MSEMQDSSNQINENGANGPVAEADDALLGIEADVVGEIGNMSMGAAATVLSELLERKVTITAPEVRYVSLDQIKEKYPIPCVTVSIEYSKGVIGTSVLVMKEEDALSIAQQMIQNSLGDIEVHELDDLALSALGECMNQMMGAAATSLAKFIGEEIDISPPKIDRVDLREDIESMRNLVGVTHMVQTVFKLFIEGLVESDVLQLMHVEFAKTLSNKLLNTISTVLASPPEESKDEPEISGQYVADLDSSSDDKQHVRLDESPKAGPHPSTEYAGLERKSPLDAEDSAVNIDLIRALPVEIKVILGQSRAPLRELISLGKGAIIELDTHEHELVDIRVNDCLIAKGEVVVVNEQYGVRIVEIVDARERLMSLKQE